MFVYKTNFTKLTMLLSYIPQCTSQNRNVHIFVLNGVLWDMGQVHHGFWEFGQLCGFHWISFYKWYCLSCVAKIFWEMKLFFNSLRLGFLDFFFSFCQVDGVIYQHKNLLQIPSWFAFMWKLRNGKSISVHFSHELYNDILRYDIPVLMYRDTKSEPCVMWGYLLQVRSLAPYEMWQYFIISKC